MVTFVFSIIKIFCCTLVSFSVRLFSPFVCFSVFSVFSVSVSVCHPPLPPPATYRKICVPYTGRASGRSFLRSVTSTPSAATKPWSASADDAPSRPPTPTAPSHVALNTVRTGTKDKTGMRMEEGRDRGEKAPGMLDCNSY